MRPRSALTTLLTLVLACCAGCSEPAEQSSTADVGTPAPAPTGPPQVQGVEGWVERAPTGPMRWREWVLGEGDPELVVVAGHWPTGVGSLEQNLDRWRAQITPGDGDPAPHVEETLRDGLRISLLDGRGTVGGMSGGGTPEQRMLAAFVDAPQGRFPGAYTFKLSGPRDRVDAWAASFREFLAGL